MRLFRPYLLIVSLIVSTSSWALKLPKKAPTLEFKNAKGSDLPEEYAIAARKMPSAVIEMAEITEDNIRNQSFTKAQLRDLDKLQRESLARQYVILIDRSGSMHALDPNEGGQSRWKSAAKAVERMIYKIFEYDIDNTVPVFLFGSNVESIGEVTDPNQVIQIFKEYSPNGTTNLEAGLRAALEEYLGKRRKNYKTVPGTTIIVLTDGCPDSHSGVEKVIHELIDPKNGCVENHEELAISFVQIGDDNGATQWLQYLDDNFQPDLIDTKKDDILREKNGLDTLLYDAIFD